MESHSVIITSPFLSRIKLNPHQEYNRWRPNEGDGCGEFPLVASTVASSLLVCILSQPQLLHSPLRHLQNSKQTAQLRQNH